MLDSPHTLVTMLTRGNALVFEKHLSKMPREPALRNTCHGPWTSFPQRAFHPTDHVQQDIHPTDNQPQSARKRGAGEAQHRVRLLRGQPPSSVRQSLCTLVLQSSTPAPGAPSPWDSVLGDIEDIISQCTFLQMTYTARSCFCK
jgi:hypothetical protein